MTERAPKPCRAQTRRWDLASTGSLGLLLAGVMAWAIPRTIQAGDAGEFSTIMLRGGVPHPSGYPWMRTLGLLARLAEMLGVAPATAAALPCALLGILGFCWLQRLLTRWCRTDATERATPVAVAAVVGVVATSAVVVLHVFDAEVWGPLVFAAAAVLDVSTRPRVHPFAVGLVFGLAITHHLSAALLLPVVVAGSWPGFRARRILTVTAWGLGGGLVGLGFFLTLMIGDGAWRWGELDSWIGLLRHIGRADYGSLSLSLHTEAVSPLALVVRSTASIGRALSAGIVTLPAAASALTGVLLLATVRARAPNLAPRVSVGLWITAAVCVLGFPALTNIDPASPFGAWILERFDVLSLVVLCAPLTFATTALVRAAPPSGRVRAGLGVFAALLIVRQLLVTAWTGVASDGRLVARYAADLLRTPAAGEPAIVFGTDDHRTFAVLFSQEVLGLAPEVLYVDASLLAHPWYRAYLRGRLPQLPDVDKPVRLMASLWSNPNLRELPVYLANDFSLPSSRLPRVPEGILWRVIPPGVPQPAPKTVYARHIAALGRYGHPPFDVLLAAHPFDADLAATYATGTAGLVRVLQAEGLTREADALLQAAFGE